MSRKVCNTCGQELSHAAYYRHLNDRYGQACPAKYQKHDNLDSTFDFGSSSSNVDSDSDVGLNKIDDLESSLISEAVRSYNNVLSDSEESGAETSEQEEMWETSAEESSDQEDVLHNNSVESIVFGLSVFLNLFQLIFRVSERAMYALLGFLRILITHLSALSPTNPLLWQLSISLPKSLTSIRKFIKQDSSTSEYVVCPRCCKLY